MKRNPLRHFFTNIVCGLIANKARRKKVRVLLNSDVRTYMKFIRRDIGKPIKKLRTAIGYGAKNLIIIVNDEYVYKFPLSREKNNDIALREKRIVDAFKHISPLPVPSVELLELDGIYVRKYPFVGGVTFDKIPDTDVAANKDRWASQVANFVYAVAQSDPKEIRDLRPSDIVCRGPMCGWCHIDICGNFMIHPETKDIIAIIDWEDCRYCDFGKFFEHSSLHNGSEFLHLVRDKYLELYNMGGK